MTFELRVVQTSLELLNQFGGTGDLDALRPHQFDRAGIHHRDIRNRAERRVLHRDALRAFQKPRQSGVLFLPAGIRQLLARQRVDDVPDSIRCTRPRGSPVGGDQVIPAPRDMPRRRESEHAIRQRIAPVMIEEEPAVKLLAPQRFLYAKEVHAIRE